MPPHHQGDKAPHQPSSRWEGGNHSLMWEVAQLLEEALGGICPHFSTAKHGEDFMPNTAWPH